VELEGRGEQIGLTRSIEDESKVYGLSARMDDRGGV